MTNPWDYLPPWRDLRRQCVGESGTEFGRSPGVERKKTLHRWPRGNAESGCPVNTNVHTTMFWATKNSLWWTRRVCIIIFIVVSEKMKRGWLELAGTMFVNARDVEVSISKNFTILMWPSSQNRDGDWRAPKLSCSKASQSLLLSKDILLGRQGRFSTQVHIEDHP